MGVELREEKKRRIRTVVFVHVKTTTKKLIHNKQNNSNLTKSPNFTRNESENVVAVVVAAAVVVKTLESFRLLHFLQLYKLKARNTRKPFSLFQRFLLRLLYYIRKFC